MSTQHTPGPWKVIEREVLEDGSVYPRHILGGHCETEVCQMEASVCASAFINDPAWQKLANSEMAMANARLIAAAPDLLEALQSYSLAIDENNIALSCIEFGAEAVERELKRRAAIAKAMGAA